MTEFVEQLQAAFESTLSNLNTMLPGVVQSYDPARNRAVVRPTLPKQLADGRTLDAPDVFEVPVAWPAAGGAIMTMPVKPGDGAMLLFAARSLEGWLSGDDRAPLDPRQFDLSDAVAILGLRATGVSADPDAVEILFDGSKVRLEPGGISRIQGATLHIEMSAGVHIATPTTTHEGNIAQTGNFNQNGNFGTQGRVDAVGDIVAGTVSLKTHVHTASGGSGLGGPPAGS